jgi:glycosyltransferase involved in cell wall biosynthesis
VVPTYQRASLVCEAVDSALSQTLADLEVVVVDDGSTDGTPAVLAARYGADPRVRVVVKANGGTASARNAGVRAARGRTVALLDSDDLLLPHHAATLTAALEGDPAADLAIGDARYEGGWPRDGRTVFGHRGYRPPADLEDMLAGLWAMPSATLWRTAALRRLGFDETRRWAEDTEILFRFFAAGGRAVAVPEVVTRYRRHSARGDGAHKRSSYARIRHARLACREEYADRARDPARYRARLDRCWARHHRKAGDLGAALPYLRRWRSAAPLSPSPLLEWARAWWASRERGRARGGASGQRSE